MGIYEDWLESKRELDKAKEKELELRNKIAHKVLGSKSEGAKTERNGGYKITATAKLNRAIDREALSATWDLLSDEEKNCINYKPTLNLAAYKKIESGVVESDGLLMDCITVKPGTVELKVIPEEE